MFVDDGTRYSLLPGQESYYSCPQCEGLLAIGPLGREAADALIEEGCPYCGEVFESLDELLYDLAVEDW